MRLSLFEALKQAGLAALLALGLSFPILALRSDQDMNNRLIVEERWSWAIGAAVAIFVLRLVGLYLQDWRAARPDAAGARAEGGQGRPGQPAGAGQRDHRVDEQSRVSMRKTR